MDTNGSQLRFLNTISLSTSDDGCELQLDSAAFVSNGNINVSNNEEHDIESVLALPETFDSLMPKNSNLQKVGICPTFSTFTFTGWSLEQEERLMEDGKVEMEKVILITDIECI